MEFFLLGPVQAGRAGRPVNLGVRKQRFVLAVLALEVNRQVTAERLVDLVWPGNPPATARGMIHTYISGLRAVLASVGDVWLESQGLLGQNGSRWGLSYESADASAPAAFAFGAVGGPGRRLREDQEVRSMRASVHRPDRRQDRQEMRRAHP